MAEQTVALVGTSGDHSAQLGQRRPHLRTGVRQPQVQVVMGGDGVEQLDVGGGQSGVAEQGQPGRQVACRLAQPGNGCCVPDMRWVDRHRLDESAPQLWLPVQVGGEVAGVAGKPVGEELRALPGVGGEESGYPTGHGVAPALT